MDPVTINLLGDLVQKVGVPASLVVFLFLVYVDVRPILTQVIKDWLLLHFQQKVLIAKIQAGQIVPDDLIKKSNGGSGTKVP
jgi:hypothetical protein